MNKKKFEKLLNDIPVLDANDKGFEKKLEFMLWSTGGSSDYRNDRERPYTGQSHTDEGVRGTTEIKGLTMRDMADCIVQGFLSASGDPDLQKKVFEKDKDFIDTEYASKGNWRVQDVFKIDLSTIDPLAVIQNTMCFVEHYMGIYPNVGNMEEI